MGAASELDTITAPIRNARGALACCGWIGAARACTVDVSFEVAVEEKEGAAAATACRDGAASRLDTSAAPTRQVRVTNLSSATAAEEAAAGADGDHALDGATEAGAAAGLGADEASGLDTITAPIRNVRGALACGWAEAAWAGAGQDDAEAAGDE